MPFTCAVESGFNWDSIPIESGLSDPSSEVDFDPDSAPRLRNLVVCVIKDGGKGLRVARRRNEAASRDLTPRQHPGPTSGRYRNVDVCSRLVEGLQRSSYRLAVFTIVKYIAKDKNRRLKHEDIVERARRIGAGTESDEDDDLLSYEVFVAATMISTDHKRASVLCECKTALSG